MTLSLKAATPSFLHTRGQDIVNESGEKLLLRGVGLGNWMLPEGYMWKFGKEADRPRRIEKLVEDLIGPERSREFWKEFHAHYITEADIRRIGELGFNSVRPALNSRLFLTDDGIPQENTPGFRLLDNLVSWAAANGIYVIIDMHGAPGGQTGQNIDDSVDDLPRLFMEEKYQDQLVALWTAIARRYQDQPAVAGYDLLNEPLPEKTGAAKKYGSRLEPLYQRLTKAIRAVDSRHLIILEGVDWANDWSVFTGPFDENLVYQFHYYCWDNPPVVKSIQTFLDYRSRWNTPVWVGETGEKDNAIYWATTASFEAHNIGWSFWPWKKMDTRNTPCSIKLPSHWSDVVAYSQGGEKPSSEVANQAFAELLVNVRLTNCVFHPEVVNAMLRRAPVRIEAENFGTGGQNESYFVNETNRTSRFYRLSQPVIINSREIGRGNTEQFISLGAREWTDYDVSSDNGTNYQIKIRIKANAIPTDVRLTAGHQVRIFSLKQNDWTEVALEPVLLNRGENHLKCLVETGAADVDWIELRSPNTEP